MAGIGRGKVFADGQLPGAKTTLYTVPVDKVAYIRFLSLHNTDSGTHVCKVYVNTSGTSRMLYRENLAANTSVFLMQGETLILEGGDIIEGECASANVVDYVICGIEES